MFWKLHKLVVSVVALALVGGFFFGRDAFSYVSTAAGRLKDSVRLSVPVEFEIDRARKLVKDLVPEIRRNMHVIAQEEVEVERTESQITELEATLAKERDEMARLKLDLETKTGPYEYAGRNYTADEVKTDLARRLERFKTNTATLASVQDIRAARTRSLDAARQKLDGMLAAKRQLEVDVASLEARLKVVEVAQTNSHHHIDESQLGRAREAVAEVRSRLHVAERLVQVEDKLHGEIPVAEATPENILEQVGEVLGQTNKVAQVSK